jgi:hypothetical protein
MYYPRIEANSFPGYWLHPRYKSEGNYHGPDIATFSSFEQFYWLLAEYSRTPEHAAKSRIKASQIEEFLYSTWASARSVKSMGVLEAMKCQSIE